MMLRFLPILAGATFRDRLIACLGALVAIAVTGVIGAQVVGSAAAVLIVAPVGASAVLVFAVPASPLAQPWPVIGGNLVSALVGVSVARLVSMPAVAAGIAVAGAILAMSLSRSLHPPGGATALLAVIGGPEVAAAGYGFALVPIALNAVVLTAIGVAFHRLSGHSYPHVAALAGVEPALAPGAGRGAGMPHREDIDRALADLGETFDVSRDDLDLLLQRAEHHALQRLKLTK